MQFQHAFAAPVPADVTWRFVSNIPVVLTCLPGCGPVQDLGGDRYHITLTQRVGPFQVSFQVEASVERDVAGRRIRAKGEGKDGRMGNSIQFDMALQVTEGAQVEISSEITVRGPVAQLGFGIMQHKARETFAEFAVRVRKALEPGGGDHAPVSAS